MGHGGQTIPRRGPDHPSRSRVAGLVLAGGASQRFGSEKAAALLWGRPLLAWACDALAPHCRDLAVNAPRGSRAEALARNAEIAVLRDDPAHASGPLAGIAAGLAWARRNGATALLTLPCDTPLVAATDIGRLVAAAARSAAAYAVSDDGPQPLAALWPVGADLDTVLRSGVHPPVAACLADLGAEAVWFPADRLRNLNRPDDLAEVERGVTPLRDGRGRRAIH